jgi:hypothetical protein
VGVVPKGIYILPLLFSLSLNLKYENAKEKVKLYCIEKSAHECFDPYKTKSYSKFRLLIMRLIFSLKLDAYPGSISIGVMRPKSP